MKKFANIALIALFASLSQVTPQTELQAERVAHTVQVETFHTSNSSGMTLGSVPTK